MNGYPDLTLMLASEYQRELTATAEQYRLLRRARRARRAARLGRRRGGMSDPAGTLAPCAPAAA
ncbi:MAG TPA: hypothetical protein VIL37_10210 [Natronosporangium sp.]